MHNGDEFFPERAAERVAAVALELVEHTRQQVFRRKPADVAVARFFSHHRELGARDRRFLSDLVFSYFRWRGWFILGDREDVPLACAVGYALDAEKIPNVVTVLAEKSSTRETASTSLCPMGRQSLAARQQLAERILQRACPPEQLLPSWAPAHLYIPDGDPTHILRCVASFQERPPVWLYALKNRRQDVLVALRMAGVDSADSGPLPGAIRVPEQSPLRSLPREWRAQFIIQDLSSQCVARACSPQPGELWFDACAGAGGKTLHLADLMDDSGQVVATDIRPDMLRELYRRSRETGFTVIKIGAGTGTDDFDGVLVDAPCSGLGTWARNPDARWRARESDVRWAERRQREILDRAARRVKRGGVLVYSVCTLTQEETVNISEWFLATHRAFREEAFTHPLNEQRAPSAAAWVWPWDGPCGGMFIARFRRVA